MASLIGTQWRNGAEILLQERLKPLIARTARVLDLAYLTLMCMLHLLPFAVLVAAWTRVTRFVMLYLIVLDRIRDFLKHLLSSTWRLLTVVVSAIDLLRRRSVYVLPYRDSLFAVAPMVI